MNSTLKSIGAILVGLIAVFVLSILTDMALESTGLMQTNPFDANPWWLIVIVIIYRNIYGAAGSYLAARFAPNKPMRHAMILGFIGFALTIVGAVVMWDMPPHWYPLTLIVLALPSAWLGGKLYS
ncbi:MAG TPA: hypothetical protein VGQ59_21960 [Cyclobacteriaceae bacterium]|jgi:uncharacterized membrane protein|nr:hypothetical protein [Cyclobacteriaceae bacterium]